MIKKSFFISALCLQFILHTPTAFTAPGDLDTSFDSDGIAYITFADLYPDADILTSGARGVRQFSNGYIYVGGLVTATTLTPASIDSDFTLSRLNSDGSLDTSFGSSGRVTTDFLPNYNGTFSLSSDATTDMAVRPDGKIVLIGTSLVIDPPDFYSNFAISVYNADGSLDSTFNASGPLPGTLIIEPETASVVSSANSIAVQSDNKMLLAGLTIDPTNFFDFTIIRINTDGSLDTSFNPSGSTPGILTLNLLSTPSVEIPLSIIYLSETDQIAVGGVGTFDAGNLLDFALIKLNSDASFDTAFGTNGIVSTDVLGVSQDILYSLELQTNGQIVAVGSTDTTSSTVRYQSSNGALDTTFGSSGVFNTNGIDGTNDSVTVNAINSAIQDDDSVFIVGSSGTEIGLVKMLSSGELDTSFNPDGNTPGVVHTAPGSSNAGRAASVQSDGKILVVGDSNGLGSGGQQIILRYLGNTADLSIQKTADEFVNPNSSFDFTITVNNSGPDTAGAVNVSDELASGLQLNNISVSQGSCTGTTSISCSLGDIESGASATVILNVTPITANIFQNTATVSAQVIDNDTSNNSATVTVSVFGAQGSGCSLVKSANQTSSPLSLYGFYLALIFLLRFFKRSSLLNLTFSRRIR